MDLRPLLRAAGISIKDLQRMLAWKSYPSLHERVSGKRVIGLVLARRIHAATKGAIPASTILGLNIPKHP